MVVEVVVVVVVQVIFPSQGEKSTSNVIELMFAITPVEFNVWEMQFSSRRSFKQVLYNFERRNIISHDLNMNNV